MKMIQTETKLLWRIWDGTSMLMSLCKNASISQMVSYTDISFSLPSVNQSLERGRKGARNGVEEQQTGTV